MVVLRGLCDDNIEKVNIISNAEIKKFDVKFENIVYEVEGEMQIQLCSCDVCTPENALKPVLNFKYVSSETDYLEVLNLGMDASGNTYMVEYFIPGFSCRKIKDNNTDYEFNFPEYGTDGKILFNYCKSDNCFVINNRTPKRLYVRSVFNTNDIVSMVENDKILRKDGKIILQVNEKVICTEEDDIWNEPW